MIDAALLRPGRLEVHVEIQLPDIEGREEILFILLKPLVQGDSKNMSYDVIAITYDTYRTFTTLVLMLILTLTLTY